MVLVWSPKKAIMRSGTCPRGTFLVLKTCNYEVWQLSSWHLSGHRNKQLCGLPNPTQPCALHRNSPTNILTPSVGLIYSIPKYIQKCIFPNPAPEGRTETLQLTLIPQVLAWYIQYQHIYSKMYIPPPCARRAHRNSPNSIQPLSVGIIYPIPTYIFNWHIFPNPAPEGRTETLQLTFIPQVLAWYIQYQHITSTLGGWM